MQKILITLLDYIFYKKCYLCSKKAEHGLLCRKCSDKLKKQRCKMIKNIEGIKIEGYFVYEAEIQKLIRAIKYHNKTELAVPIAEILASAVKYGENIEIVPVPLHPNRQKKRKYNQVALIAKEMGFNINENIIKRVKDTRPHYKLNQKQRQENLTGAFRVYPEYYSGKKLLLFDDISTTGATLREMIRELRKNGINNIAGLVVCFTHEF